MHDLYDPPPLSAVEWEPPKAGPLIFSRGDLVCLIGLCAGLLIRCARRLEARARSWP